MRSFCDGCLRQGFLRFCTCCKPIGPTSQPILGLRCFGSISRLLQCIAVPARTLLGLPCPVTGLLEAVQSDPTWWISQVKAAVKAFGKDLQDWQIAAHRPDGKPVQPPPLSQACFLFSAGGAMPRSDFISMSRFTRLVRMAPCRPLATTLRNPMPCLPQMAPFCCAGAISSSAAPCLS